MTLNNSNIPTQFNTVRLVNTNEQIVTLQQALHVLSLIDVKSFKQTYQSVGVQDATDSTVNPEKRLSFAVNNNPTSIASAVGQSDIESVINADLITLIAVKHLYNIVRDVVTVLSQYDSNSTVVSELTTLLAQLPDLSSF